MKKIYEVYDKDKLVAKGDIDEIIEKTGYSHTTLRRNCREGKKVGSLTIKQVGTKKTHYRTFEKICHLPKQKPRPIIEYLIEHLESYGNTVLGENPQKYEEELKKNKIKIKYHQSIYDKKCYIVEKV